MHTFCWVPWPFESQSRVSTQVFRRKSSMPNFSWTLHGGEELEHRTFMSTLTLPLFPSLIFCHAHLQNNRFFSTEFCEILISRFFWIPYSLCFKKLIKCLPNTSNGFGKKMMKKDTFFITLYSESKSSSVIENFPVRSSRFHSLFKSPPNGKKNRTQSSS